MLKHLKKQAAGRKPKNYNKQLESTGWSLKYNQHELAKKQERLAGIEKDWQEVQVHLTKDEEGNRPNPIKLDKFEYNNRSKTCIH